MTPFGGNSRLFSIFFNLKRFPPSPVVPRAAQMGFLLPTRQGRVANAQHTHTHTHMHTHMHHVACTCARAPWESAHVRGLRCSGRERALQLQCGTREDRSFALMRALWRSFLRTIVVRHVLVGHVWSSDLLLFTGDFEPNVMNTKASLQWNHARKYGI
jgi:hypothetical protein